MLLSNLNLLATAPGGVARLRELILTLAVQGKLVPQDPKDEPASALLKKIRAEKDRLIAEGRIKRDKPLAEIAEEEKPFGLPEGWEWVRLYDLIRIGSGDGLTAAQMAPGGAIPVYGGNGVNGHHDQANVDGPTLVIGRVGYYCGSVHITPAKAWVTDNAFITLFPKACLEMTWLYWLLVGTNLKENDSATAQPVISGRKLYPIVVALPPLAEQSRIVTRVEELMRLCDALEAKGKLEAAQHAQLVSALLATLSESETPAQLTENWHRIATHFDLLLDRPEAVDALEQTILQLAVRGLLVPQDPQDEPASELLKKIRAEKDKLIAEGKIKRDKPLPPIGEDEQPFALPVGWEWVRLRELVTHLGDGLHGTPNYSLNGDYYFVNGNNLGAGVITIKPETKRVDQTEFEKHRKPLDATTVLLSINGTLGRVAFYQNEMIVLGKSACYFNVTVGLQKIFAKLLLECPDFMAYAEKSATGTTIKNLGLKAIGDWPIALPPLAEQSRIVTRVAQLRRLCADLRQRLSASQSTQAHLAEALVDTMASGLPVS